MGCYGALHNSAPRITALHKDARARAPIAATAKVTGTHFSTRRITTRLSKPMTWTGCADNTATFPKGNRPTRLWGVRTSLKALLIMNQGPVEADAVVRRA